MEEATHDGVLVRLHNPFPRVRISCFDGRKYCIQRDIEPRCGDENTQVIHCNSPFISNCHCQIFRKSKAFWIIDLKSTNGTFLNGVRLENGTARELRFGDIFGAGLSHVVSDVDLDVTSSNSFVFKFEKWEQEVVRSDDEETEIVSTGSTSPGEQKVATGFTSTAAPNGDGGDDEDDDIEIIEEIFRSAVNRTSTTGSSPAGGNASNRSNWMAKERPSSCRRPSVQCKKQAANSRKFIRSSPSSETRTSNAKTCSSRLKGPRSDIDNSETIGSILGNVANSKRTAQDEGPSTSSPRKRLKSDRKISTSSSSSDSTLRALEAPIHTLKSKSNNTRCNQVSSRLNHYSSSESGDEINSSSLSRQVGTGKVRQMEKSGGTKRKFEDDVLVAPTRPGTNKKACASAESKKTKNPDSRDEMKPKSRILPLTSSATNCELDWMVPETVTAIEHEPCASNMSSLSSKRVPPKPSTVAKSAPTRDVRLLENPPPPTRSAPRAQMTHPGFRVKKQLEKEANSSPDPVKTTATAKIKYASHNRNQGMMEDRAGKKYKNTEPVASSSRSIAARMWESSTADNKGGNSKNLAEEIASPESELLGRGPRLMAGSSIYSTLQTSVLESPKVPNTHLVLGQNISRYPHGPKALLKPGADVILSPPQGNSLVSYKESTAMSRRTANLERMEPTELVPWWYIYKRIFKWSPTWLEEQNQNRMTKNKKEPPVYGEAQCSATLANYNSFEEYFSTYYPLLLLEMWAGINKDAGKSKSDNNNVGPARCSNYQIKIDCVQSSTRFPPDSCRLIMDEKMIFITYHAWAKTRSYIDNRKNLVVLTVQEKDASGKKIERQLFCFSIYKTTRCDPINTPSDCDPRLLPTGVKNGFRYSEILSCQSTLPIKFESIATISRVSYILPKIREFRAINTLKSSPLYNDIVTPRARKNAWDSTYINNLGGRSYDMIPLCRKLNSEQQSVIAQISKRVFSSEPDIMLLHGPPGTGKTTTIVAATMQLLVESLKKNSQGTPRILICTPSNAAVDEILRRLVSAKDDLPNTLIGGKNLSIVRVGDGCAKDVLKYTVGEIAQAAVEKNSVAVSIQAELTSLENEIEEKRTEIESLRNSAGANHVQIQSKVSSLNDLESRKTTLSTELRVATERKKTNKVPESVKYKVLTSANIVCSTLGTIGNSLVRNAFLKRGGQHPFLWCIVDEASQATEPETLLPLSLKVDKMLLVGDPLQLGATVLSHVALEKGYGQSLFNRLYKFYYRKSSNSIMMLKRQYRMHPDIVKWPNIYFYDGELISQHKAPHASFTLHPYYFFNLHSGREHSDKEGHIENLDEIKMVEILLDTMDEMLRRSKLQWTVGVITPYQAQKRGIRKAVEQKTFRSFTEIDVDTVDGFQGQERDIIVLSCVRTDAIGFLKSRNRLNVALTRAKHSMYIIGHVRCLAQNQAWRCLIQDAAQRNCKYDVNPDFKMDPSHTMNLLSLKLKK